MIHLSDMIVVWGAIKGWSAASHAILRHFQAMAWFWYIFLISLLPWGLPQSSSTGSIEVWNSSQVKECFPFSTWTFKLVIMSGEKPLGKTGLKWYFRLCIFVFSYDLNILSLSRVEDLTPSVWNFWPFVGETFCRFFSFYALKLLPLAPSWCSG